jgi:DNA-binding transcriptional MerR regulator
MGTHHPIRKTVTPEIPDKLYFRIGDVARICEVPAYVLRFWETEFPQLKPNKGGTGQRLYRKRDVEMALRIKSLLYDQGYTIPGARQVFKAEKPELRPAEVRGPDFRGPDTRSGEPAAKAPQLAVMVPAEAVPDATHSARIQALRSELREIHALLSRPASSTPRSPKLQTLRPRLAPEPPRSQQLSLDDTLF